MQFLEKSLEERTNHERQYMSSWTSQKSEMSNEIRQVCQKYEAELNQINLKLDEERERAQEAETALSSLQMDLQSKNELWRDSETRYKQMIEQA